MVSKAVYPLLLFLILLTLFLYNKTEKQSNQITSDGKLIESLTDSIRYSKDKYNRIVAEKKVIQSTVDDLEKANKILTDNQKRLLKEVKDVKNVKVGIQVREKVIIDSIEYKNDKSIIISDVKGGQEVKIVNSNPDFITEETDVIFIPTKKKWYNSKAFKIGLVVVGILTGIGISR